MVFFVFIIKSHIILYYNAFLGILEKLNSSNNLQLAFEKLGRKQPETFETQNYQNPVF